MGDVADGTKTSTLPNFKERVLASARGLQQGLPGTSLEALLARQQSTILPRNFRPPVELHLTFFARPHDLAKTQITVDLWVGLNIFSRSTKKEERAFGEPPRSRGSR